MKASEVRKGHVLIVEGQPCRVMDFQHRTPGNLRAFVQIRMRNLVSGNTFDTRYIATEYVDEARLDTKEYQVMYRDESGVHAQDLETYDQISIDPEVAGDAAEWLQSEMQFQAELLNGKVVGIELPSSLECVVVETTPVMRGATKTASSKPAKLDNGITIQVPEFLEQGVRIRVDPRTGTYLERAK